MQLDIIHLSNITHIHNC